MTHNEIHRICREYGIKNYNINEDDSIDVNGDVYLFNKNLIKIPLKFNKVSGYFDCSYNKLISLKGSPIEVDGDFDCRYNQLTILKYAPLKVGKHFICLGNLVELNYENYIKKTKRISKLSQL